MFDSVSSKANIAGERFSRAGSDFAEGMKNVFKKSPRMADEAFEAATKPGVIQTVVTAPLKAGWYVVSRPIAWGVQFAGYGAEKLGAGFKARPGVGLAAAGVVAAVGVGHVLNKRAERNAQATMADLQTANAAMAQAQANTVTPQEYAAMEARMKQGGRNGGFAAGVQAERAQGAAGPAV